jgi:tetratricopeptide (TPR) repeat protein
MDIYRKRKRQRELGVSNLEELEGLQSPGAATGLKTPQQSYLDRELDAFVRQAVRALPDRLRQPMVLRFFRQLSYQEIGRELRISEENARKRVQQARAMLRERLAGYSEGRPGPVPEILDPEDTLPAEVQPAAALSSPQGNEELGARAVTLRAVVVLLPSGVSKDFLLFLPKDERRNPEARLAALRRYALKHPGGWKKRREIAEVLYLAGRWEEALLEYRFVLDKQPFLFEAWLRAGEILRGLGRDPEAVEAFERAHLLARGPGTRQHLRGWIDLCNRVPAAALVSFAEAAVIEPAHPAHWVAMGELHLAADRPLEALAAFDQALAVEPDDLRALTASHGALLAAGRSREARRRASRALEIAPTSFVAAKRLVDLRCRGGQVGGKEGKETRALLRAALHLAPDWSGGQDSLALYHLARGQQAEAEAVLARFVERHPKHAGGWSLYARCLRRMGKERPAATAVLAALALDRSDREIYLLASRILPHILPAEAGPIREEMLERFPESWRTWAVAGASLVDSQEPGRACLAARQAVQLQPRLAAAWLGYGTVLSLSGELREAIAALKRAWGLLPPGDGLAEAPPIAFRLAESHRLLGETAEAVETEKWFRNTVTAATELLDFDLPAALFWRGKALAGLSDSQAALRDYRQALRGHLFEPARSEVLRAVEVLEAGLARTNEKPRP